MPESSSSSGEWLQAALMELRERVETGLELDDEVISGLVSYCEMAPPQDAREYLSNIVGEEAGRTVITEYMHRRGLIDQFDNTQDVQSAKLQVYMKPSADMNISGGSRKQNRTLQKESPVILNPKTPAETSDTHNRNKANSSNSKKKKSGRAISLADAAKGSVVFQQGKPCLCQARRHKLVSNCLSCGKIVCEQEGEGPCSFCGALVLKEGSTYAGLEDAMVAQSDAEVAAEAFAKRLVDYDRNAAARTTVIDDQSDYYEIEGNSWLSAEEKGLLKKKQQETEDADRARRSKVIVTFDLVGRKVLLNEDEAREMESEHRILRPTEEREINRIKPNPTVRIQPIFVDPGPINISTRVKRNTTLPSGLCLEISGRVQHEGSNFQLLLSEGSQDQDDSWKRPPLSSGLCSKGDDNECYLD